MKAIMLVILGLMFTGCTSLGVHRMFENGEQGYVMLAGDAEGIRAYNDGLVGHITEAKNNPENKSAYWQAREQETAVKTLKFRVKPKGGSNE